MSNNKYIIDKDSLTGIANIVRDKLGVGEATTDETTGEIIYPEDKGYYLKDTFVAKWKKEATTDTWSGTGTEYVIRANVTEEQLLRVCNGVRPVYVKIDIDLTSSGGNIIVENSLTSWSASNPIVTLPTSGRFFCQYVYSHSSYSTQFRQKSIPAVIFSFLDENQKIIIPENASKIVDESYNRNLLQESVNAAIPFSIGDIQNKITNYLSKGGSSFEYPIPTQTLSSGSGAWYLNLESTFSSVEDFKNRFLQASVNMGTNYQAFYLVCGKDGKPASMKELGITLRNDIYSNLGSWDMNDVRTSYENNLTFPLVWLSSPVDKNTFWLYVTSDAKNMVFCAHGLVGYQLSNSGYLYVAYKEA